MATRTEKLKQIAWVINEQLLPNIVGLGETNEDGKVIAPKIESVGELVDFGKTLGVDTLDADTFKDWTGQFVLSRIKYHFDELVNTKKGFSIIKSFDDFVGMSQVIRMKNLKTKSQTNIHNLKDGEFYNQDIYHGVEIDDKLFTNVTTFEDEFSIPITMYRNMFSEDGMLEFDAYIRNWVEVSMEVILEELAKSTIRANIAKVHGTNREIDVLKIYNDTFRPSDRLSKAEAIHNRAFLSWLNQTVENIRSGMDSPNYKYNDGTVVTTTPRKYSNVILLDMVALSSKFNLESVTYHDDKVAIGNFETLGAWQTSGDDIIPNFDIVSMVSANFTGKGTDNINVHGVIGVIYDERGLAVSLRPDVSRAHFNAKGNFNNYFTTITQGQLTDSRHSFISLVMVDPITE